MLERAAALFLCFLDQQVVDLARRQVIWQPAMAVGNDGTGSFV